MFRECSSLNLQNQDLSTEQLQVKLNTKQTEIETLKIKIVQIKKDSEDAIKNKVAMDNKVNKLMN